MDELINVQIVHLHHAGGGTNTSGFFIWRLLCSGFLFHDFCVYGLSNKITSSGKDHQPFV
jgi:hypothetical protein